MTHTIDAQNKKIGRVASEAAKILMQKNTTSYAPNVAPKAKVTIVNASKADISAKKMSTKKYIHYTGHPGGLKTYTMGQVIGKKGYGELFKTAIKGMLPKNKLQAIMMKNLVVTE